MSVAIGPPPQVKTIDELVAVLWPFLESVSAEFYYMRIERAHTAPAKPQDGQLAYADGVDWNPGSGRGVYRYDSTSVGWVLLG